MAEGVLKANSIASLLDKWEVDYYIENSYIYIPREEYDITCSSLKSLGYRDLKSSYR
jgi:hypothetical protein